MATYRVVEKEGCRSNCIIESAESVAVFMLGRRLSDFIVIKNDVAVVRFHESDYNSMANACAATVAFEHL
jgi:hypothetical protein